LLELAAVPQNDTTMTARRRLTMAQQHPLSHDDRRTKQQEPIKDPYSTTELQLSPIVLLFQGLGRREPTQHHVHQVTHLTQQYLRDLLLLAAHDDGLIQLKAQRKDGEYYYYKKQSGGSSKGGGGSYEMELQLTATVLNHKQGYYFTTPQELDQILMESWYHPSNKNGNTNDKDDTTGATSSSSLSDDFCTFLMDSLILDEAVPTVTDMILDDNQPDEKHNDENPFQDVTQVILTNSHSGASTDFTHSQGSSRGGRLPLRNNMTLTIVAVVLVGFALSTALVWWVVGHLGKDVVEWSTDHHGGNDGLVRTGTTEESLDGDDDDDDDHESSVLRTLHNNNTTTMATTGTISNDLDALATATLDDDCLLGRYDTVPAPLVSLQGTVKGAAAANDGNVCVLTVDVPLEEVHTV